MQSNNSVKIAQMETRIASLSRQVKQVRQDLSALKAAEAKGNRRASGLSAAVNAQVARSRGA